MASAAQTRCLTEAWCSRQTWGVQDFALSYARYLIFQDMADADEDRRIDCQDVLGHDFPRLIGCGWQEFANFVTSGKAEKVGIKVP